MQKMKRIIMAICCAGLGYFLTGCWTVYETPPAQLNRIQYFPLNLRLEGFSLETLQQTGADISTANATAYNWRTNSSVSAYGNSVSTHYEYRPDEAFSNSIIDAFESLGFNVRSDSPDLVLVGRFGNGWLNWRDPWLYLRDGMALLVSIPTFSAVGSYEMFNDARILVYNTKGRKIADYYSEKSCYVFSLAFPFANIANAKAYGAYGRRRATQFALIDCLNQFLADLESGRFKQEIKPAFERGMSE